MQESPGAPERLTLSPSLVLNNGVVIPRMGLGVFQARAGRDTERRSLGARSRLPSR